MPWFATSEDRVAATSIGDWIQTARDEVDDIGGWREAPGGRHWPQPPRLFRMRTQYLSGYLTTHYPQLDPAPVHDVYLHVSAWYADWNADRLPPQQVLEELLERAVLVLNSVMAAIMNRVGESITKGIPVHVLDETGEAAGVFFPEKAELVARHFETGTNAGSANLHQLPDGRFVLHRWRPFDEEVAKTARLLSAGEAAELLRSWGQPLPAGMPEVDGLPNLCIEAAQKPAPETSHSTDFTFVKWFGTHYNFGKGLQAECVRVLWEAWEKDDHSLSEKTIGEKAGSGSDRFRLYHVFCPKHPTTGKRTVHPAWKTMIRAAGRGQYCLAAPQTTK